MVSSYAAGREKKVDQVLGRRQHRARYVHRGLIRRRRVAKRIGDRRKTHRGRAWRRRRRAIAPWLMAEVVWVIGRARAQFGTTDAMASWAARRPARPAARSAAAIAVRRMCRAVRRGVAAGAAAGAPGARDGSRPAGCPSPQPCTAWGCGRCRRSCPSHRILSLPGPTKPAPPGAVADTVCASGAGTFAGSARSSTLRRPGSGAEGGVGVGSDAALAGRPRRRVSPGPTSGRSCLRPPGSGRDRGC